MNNYLSHHGIKGQTWYKRYYQTYEEKPTRSGKVGEYLGPVKEKIVGGINRGLNDIKNLHRHLAEKEREKLKKRIEEVNGSYDRNKDKNRRMLEEIKGSYDRNKDKNRRMLEEIKGSYDRNKDKNRIKKEKQKNPSREKKERIPTLEEIKDQPSLILKYRDHYSEEEVTKYVNRLRRLEKENKDLYDMDVKRRYGIIDVAYNEAEKPIGIFRKFYKLGKDVLVLFKEVASDASSLA